MTFTLPTTNYSPLVKKTLETNCCNIEVYRELMTSSLELRPLKAFLGLNQRRFPLTINRNSTVMEIVSHPQSGSLLSLHSISYYSKDGVLDFRPFQGLMSPQSKPRKNIQGHYPATH